MNAPAYRIDECNTKQVRCKYENSENCKYFEITSKEPVSQRTSRPSKKLTHTHILYIAAETLNRPSQPINATASAFPAKRSASGGKVLLDGQFDTSIKRQLWPQCACDVSSTELKGGKTAAVSLCSGCLKIVGFTLVRIRA